MKYTDKNPPLKLLLTNSTCYKGTGRMTPVGVLIHSTGAVNPNLKRYVQPTDDEPDRNQWLSLLGVNANKNDYNHQYRKMGVNAWIGKLADGSVASIQTLPWDYRPWGCGSGKNGSCNSGWIQFEICEGNKTDQKYFVAAYQEAVELTAYLCQTFGFNPYGAVQFKNLTVPVILCHADGHSLGLSSNHADIYSYFKPFGKDMDTFRDDVAAVLSATIPVSDEPGEEKPDEEEPDPEQMPPSEMHEGEVAGEAAFPYLVRITDTHLNIRKGPGKQYASRGYIKPGTYTIVDEKDGFGLLKAYADQRDGWVMLSFTTRKK